MGKVKKAETRKERKAKELKAKAEKLESEAMKVPELSHRMSNQKRREITDRKRPPREELMKLVWRRPVTALRQRYGVGHKAIYRWCDQLNIKRPDAKYWYERKQAAPPPDLQYRVIQLGIRGAAKYYGLNENTINKMATRLNIRRKDVRSPHRPPRDVLQSLVWARNQKEIAEIYGVSPGTVWGWTKQYDLVMPDMHHWIRQGVAGDGRLINPTVECECGCGTKIKYWSVYGCGKRVRRRYATGHRPGCKPEPKLIVSDEELLEERAYQIAVEMGGEHYWKEYLGEAWIALNAEKSRAPQEKKDEAAKAAIKAQKKCDFALYHMKEYSELPPDKD